MASYAHDAVLAGYTIPAILYNAVVSGRLPPAQMQQNAVPLPSSPDEPIAADHPSVTRLLSTVNVYVADTRKPGASSFEHNVYASSAGPAGVTVHCDSTPTASLIKMLERVSKDGRSKPSRDELRKAVLDHLEHVRAGGPGPCGVVQTSKYFAHATFAEGFRGDAIPLVFQRVGGELVMRQPKGGIRKITDSSRPVDDDGGDHIGTGGGGMTSGAMAMDLDMPLPTSPARNGGYAATTAAAAAAPSASATAYATAAAAAAANDYVEDEARPHKRARQPTGSSAHHHHHHGYTRAASLSPTRGRAHPYLPSHPTLPSHPLPSGARTALLEHAHLAKQLYWRLGAGVKLDRGAVGAALVAAGDHAEALLETGVLPGILRDPQPADVVSARVRMAIANAVRLGGWGELHRLVSGVDPERIGGLMEDLEVFMGDAGR